MPDGSQADRRLLLDTHVWLWLEEGNARVRHARAWEDIRQARDRRGLLVSIISVWELALLDYKRRILLSMDCAEWVRHALHAPGLELQNLTPEIAIFSTQLGDGFHADSADRFLVASALVLGVGLVTADERILAFAEKEKRLKTVPV
jgi:PIN domain nuclease of toxin-antitoxin system